jgi:Amt family ammonium transporter
LHFSNGGLVKRKNIINTIMSSIILMGIASVLWVLVASLCRSQRRGGFIGNLNWFGLSFDTLGDTTLPYPTPWPSRLSR